MARSETVLQVFLASPSDVLEEREIIESVISELNNTWSKTLGTRLELVRWETSTHPAVAGDSQAAINAQVADEYDVFVGILWGRIGTPTPRAASGTIEEFERAYFRWKTNPSGLEIMFYFKDAPIRPSEIDGGQTEKVQAFKRSLGDEGLYHWTFDGPESFESLVRVHLSQVVQGWEKKKNLSDMDESEAISFDEIGSDDDLGFLDHVDRYQLSMKQMNAGIHAVGEATVTVGQQMNRRTTELDSTGDINDSSNYKQARRTIKASSDDMNRYADILEGQLPLLAKARGDAFESLSKAIAFYSDFTSDEKANLDHLEASLGSMVDAAHNALRGMGGLRQSVVELPRLTSDINKSKRRVAKALDQFISEVETVISTAGNLLATLAAK